WIGLRHLFRAVAERHDARRRSRDQGLREREESVLETERCNTRGVVVVEFLRDIAREFQMLLLVFANGYMRRAIDENVGRHQARIGVEPDRSVLAVLAGLLLELRHAVQPAHARDAIEDPGELRVFVNL